MHAINHNNEGKNPRALTTYEAPEYIEGRRATESFERGMNALFKVPKDAVAKGAGPALSKHFYPAAALSLSLRSLQRQGGEFDFLSSVPNLGIVETIPIAATSAPPPRATPIWRGASFPPVSGAASARPPGSIRSHSDFS
jgi:hypothetical protein